MKLPTFEDYLQEVFLKDWHGVKDDFENAYDVWLERLETADVIKYAEEAMFAVTTRLNAAVILAGEAIEELKKIRAMATK